VCVCVCVGVAVRSGSWLTDPGSHRCVNPLHASCHLLDISVSVLHTLYTHTLFSRCVCVSVYICVCVYWACKYFTSADRERDELPVSWTCLLLWKLGILCASPVPMFGLASCSSLSLSLSLSLVLVYGLCLSLSLVLVYGLCLSLPLSVVQATHTHTHTHTHTLVFNYQTQTAACLLFTKWIHSIYINFTLTLFTLYTHRRTSYTHENRLNTKYI